MDEEARCEQFEVQDGVRAQYPKYSEGPRFVESDSTPCVVAWPELSERMDDLVEMGKENGSKNRACKGFEVSEADDPKFENSGRDEEADEDTLRPSEFENLGGEEEGEALHFRSGKGFEGPEADVPEFDNPGGEEEEDALHPRAGKGFEVTEGFELTEADAPEFEHPGGDEDEKEDALHPVAGGRLEVWPAAAARDADARRRGPGLRGSSRRGRCRRRC